MKKLISTSLNGQQINHDHLCQALLQYQNMLSRKDNLSPAQKLYGHPIQDTPQPQMLLCTWMAAKISGSWCAKAAPPPSGRTIIITTLSPVSYQISMLDLVWLSSIHKQGFGRHTRSSLQSVHTASTTSKHKVAKFCLQSMFYQKTCSLVHPHYPQLTSTSC